MKNLRSHKLFLIMAIVIVSCVAAIYVYMRYNVTASAAQAAAARATVLAEQANKSREQDLIRLYTESESDWGRLSKLFIPADNVVAFIETLEGLGDQTGATVKLSAISSDVVEGAKPGTISTVKAHIEAQGSWSAVMRTLKVAENLPLQVIIDHTRLDVSVLSGDKENKRVWRLSFDIQASTLASSTPSH